LYCLSFFDFLVLITNLVSFKNATFLTNKYNYLTTTNAQSDFLQKNIITLGPQMPNGLKC
jgi:hypothetical protein